MKKTTIVFLFSIILIAILNSQEYSYDPWGVWNSYPVDFTTARIITFDGNQYYEAGNSGMYIVEDCKESFPFGDHFPAFAYPGAYTRIENYRKTDYGFLFYTIGIGTRDVPINSDAEWRKDDTRIQIKMIFISPDECRFEYISKVDEEGFRLSFLPDEGVIYRRYRVPSEDDQANGNPPPTDMSNYNTTHHTTDNLRLRDEPNTSSLMVTTLSNGSAVQVLETGEMQTIDGISAPWVKVLSESGYTGWCFSGYLEAIPKEEPVIVPVSTTPEPSENTENIEPVRSDISKTNIFDTPIPFAVGGGIVLVAVGIILVVKRKKKN